MKKLTILFLSFLSWNLVFAQYNSEIDSLVKVLNGSKKEDTSKVKILNSISWKLLNIAEYEKARKHADKALLISRKLNYKIGVANAYSNIAVIFFYQGQYPEARKYFDACLKICQKTGYKKLMASCYNNIGNIYYSQSNYPQALKNFLTALKIYEECHDKLNMASLYDNVGSVYFSLGKYPEAFKYNFLALYLFKELGDKSAIGTCYSNLASNYMHQRNYKEALKYNLMALTIFQDLGDKYSIAFAYDVIGIIYYEQGNPVEALNKLFAALKINKEIGNTHGKARNLGNISNIYYKENKPVLAREYLTQAFKIAREMEDKAGIAYCYLKFSELDSVSGDFKSAFVNYRLHKQMKDSMFNMEKEKKITELSMQYEFDKKEAIAKKEQEKKEVIQASLLADTRNNRNIIISILLAALLFTGTFFYNISQRKKLRFQKQVSEVEMKALRAQMNPHFIFNSLNSIYSYIQINNYELASEYLIKFSKLIRLTLENSMRPLITLEDELKVLELYLSLEADRLKNRFTYFINVDGEIKQAATLIPPLIFQPYIENSIWHGMQNKIQDGRIEINIEKSGDMLHCVITDNGTGMTPKADSKKKSYGTSITEQRLEILNQLRNTKGYVSINNISEENNERTGVRVELAIPVEMT